MKILVTDRYSAESLAHLQQALQTSSLKYEIKKSDFSPTAEELRETSALLIRSRTQIDKNFLALCPKLKFIVSATSGFDHIDLVACKEKNIQVSHTPDANTTSAAELTLLLMLATLRRLSEVQKAIKRLDWKDSFLPGEDLYGKTVGLIGLGRVGSRVARFLQAFGAEVIAHDPYQDDQKFRELSLPRLGLTEVFVQADILSFHVPLTAETRHMVNAQTLTLCQEGVTLINTSRGTVFDEGAIVQGLEAGHIKACGLDVFENEPLNRDSRLRKMANVVLTPHIGAYTDNAVKRASESAVQQMVEFLLTGRTQNILQA